MHSHQSPRTLTPSARRPQYPTTMLEASATVKRQPEAPVSVGRLLRRRANYALRFAFWSLRHGSTKHAAWICAYEGLTW